jgi:hypothetical protein
MPNHYHLVVETPRDDLSVGMQWLNGRYAQAFNHRHAFDGHLFQGRFWSRLVESDWHLLELSGYLALNPVAAGLCDEPGAWRWSSYSAVAGRVRPRRFLAVRRSLMMFGEPRSSAGRRFEAFVNDPRPRAADMALGATPGV